MGKCGRRKFDHGTFVQESLFIAACSFNMPPRDLIFSRPLFYRLCGLFDVVYMHEIVNL